MAKSRLTRAAREDIRDIRHYSDAMFGGLVTLDYIEGLRATLALLGEKPLTGAAENDLLDGLRSFRFRSHRVYYTAEGIVLIIRILHHARDARKILGHSQ